jgi:CBS domain-containing protein
VKIRELMNSKPTYCTPYWTTEALAALMQHAGTGIIPVVEDILRRKLVGVVTDRDLCLRVVAAGEYPAHVWVNSCMTRDPVSCRPDDTVETALQLMSDKRVRRLPVVDDHMQLQGMVSISDFVRSGAAGINPVYSALKEICKPCVETGQREAETPLAA